MDHRLKLIKILLENKKDKESKKANPTKTIASKDLDGLRGEVLVHAMAHHLEQVHGVPFTPNFDTNERKPDLTGGDFTFEIKGKRTTDTPSSVRSIHYYPPKHASLISGVAEKAAKTLRASVTYFTGNKKHAEKIAAISPEIKSIRKGKSGNISFELHDDEQHIQDIIDSRHAHIIGDRNALYVIVPEKHKNSNIFGQSGIAPTFGPSDIDRGGKATTRLPRKSGGRTTSIRMSFGTSLDDQSKKKAHATAKKNADILKTSGSFAEGLKKTTMRTTKRIQDYISRGKHEEAKKLKDALDSLIKEHE
jgi:hypothetical protein